MVSSQVSDITGELLRLLNHNAPKLNTILTDVRISATQFREIAAAFSADFATLSAEVSALVSQGSSAIKTSEAGITPILKDLQTATTAFAKLEENVNRLFAAVNDSDGTIAQLLNTPEPLEDARRTLRNVDETMTTVTSLSQRTEEQLRRFDLPQMGWDYELRYLSLEERLHNELAFSLAADPSSHYRLGLGVRDENVRFEFQYAYNIADYFRARAGFMRSKVGVGFDLWLLSRRLGISVEGVGLTSGQPELNTELALRFFRYGQFLVGGENLTRERRWTTGFRFFRQ